MDILANNVLVVIMTIISIVIIMGIVSTGDGNGPSSLPPDKIDKALGLPKGTTKPNKNIYCGGGGGPSLVPKEKLDEARKVAMSITEAKKKREHE
nr:MAG TPA: hypothetical protein [Caudoviricetes sp.]